jgi:2-polyprenyl-3-methyl-5-hydroxy-6-metoxy-1,4-benzoquinol methylase
VTNAAARPTPPATGERSEQFYEGFWGTGVWSTPEPNPDEAERAAAILGLLERFPPPRSGPQARLLDVGCGRGWLTAKLAKLGNARGVDPVRAGVERAKTLFPHLDFRATDTTSLVAAGERSSYDAVVSSEVIEHIPGEAKRPFVESLRDLLVPGGIAVLTTPRGELQEWCRRHGGAQQPIEAWVTEPELARMCETSGFEVLAQDRVFVPYYPYDLGARFARSWMFRAILAVLPIAPLREFRRRRGIYQIIALRRR